MFFWIINNNSLISIEIVNWFHFGAVALFPLKDLVNRSDSEMNIDFY